MFNNAKEYSLRGLDCIQYFSLNKIQGMSLISYNHKSIAKAAILILTQ
jgi:hypothetical protein